MGRVKDTTTDNDFQLTALYGIESTAKKENMTICKSQPFLALPQTNMTLMELKIFDIYLARINPQDPTIIKVIFTKKELCNVLGIDHINKNELLKCLETLMSKIVRVERISPNGRTKTTLIALLSRADLNYADKHFDNLSSIELKCSEDAKKLIYNVDAVGYLRMNLAKVLSFDGRNSYALYQYINQNQFRGHWDIETEILKEYLGLKGKYRTIKDFEKRVLIPAKKEIESKTDLHFEYKKLRVGRQIKKISFQIIKKKELEPESEVFDDDYIPFAKDGERIDLGHYKFDDEVPEYTAEDYNNDDFINQFRPDKRPRRRW